MADLAQLGLTVDGSGAVQKLKEFSGVSDKAGQSTDALTAKLKQQDLALRQLAERGTIASDTGKRLAQITIQQNGGMERYLQIQRQIEQEMIRSDAIANQYAASLNKVGNAHLSIGRLRQGFQTLASQLVGFNPILGQIAGTLGSFAVGTAATVGILAGLAAVGFAYSKLTEESRKAKEEGDRLKDSLLAQAKSAREASVAGQEASVKMAQAAVNAARARLAVVQMQNTSPGAGYGGNVLGLVLPDRSGQNLQEATAAARQAELNLIRVRTEAIKAGWESANDSWELEKTLAADRQRWADEDRKHSDEATRRRNEELALMEKRSRLAAQFAVEEEARTARLGKAWADLIRARHEAATERLGLPSDDDLHASIKRNVEEALEAEKALKKYNDEMRAIWKQGIAKILTDGTKSYRDFFEDVLQMFTRMMARMEQEGKTKGFGYKMLGFGSALIGGGVAGYQVGQQAGGATLGALGGAAAGAATGYQFAGPMGAVIGGLAGFGAGLIGGISASREHAAALKAAMESFKQSMADFHFAATGTTGSLADLTRQVHATAAALRASAAANYHPGAWGTSPAQNAAYAAQMAQIAADEAAYVARLAEEDRLKKQYFKEDLQVRYLRATGRDAEADKLAKKQADEREYAAAVAAGADAATLAFLRTIHVAEELKKASDALSTSLRNAPSGFKIESYINRFAAARPWEPPLGMPYSPQGGPMGTGGAFPSFGKTGYTPPGQGEAQLRAGMARLSAPKATTTINIGTVTLALPPGMPPEKVGPAFMTYIRKVQLQTVGPNAPLADAMEYAS